LLQVSELSTYFYTRRGVVKAVDSISFDIEKGEIHGLVGESGCGKSVTAMSIMKLVPDPPGKIVNGTIILNGENLISKSESEMRSVRGGEIAMIFQDPLSSLNPIMKVGKQMTDAIRAHRDVSNSEALKIAIEGLSRVRIPDAKIRAEQYPFQLSGGMRQRVTIATALVCKSSLLIADEPTTNLDVTIQAQILALIKELRDLTGTSVLLITHNLGLVAWLCDRFSVMYAGKIVEQGTTEEIFRNPMHPYTQLLLKSVPRLGNFKRRLEAIGGDVPDLVDVPTGCRFHPRCPIAKKMCSEKEPILLETQTEHAVSCHMQNYEGWEES
jgi:oligopeptide/dipeptide ABC transporter ATP-binding protein